MVLTRRMAKERTTAGANNGENNCDVSGTDPDTQVSGTKASMSPVTGVYGDEAKAFVNNHAPLHRGTMTNGAQTPQITTENRNIDTCAPATSPGESKRCRGRKITTSTKSRRAAAKSGGLNQVNDSDSLNGSTGMFSSSAPCIYGILHVLSFPDSLSGDRQLSRGQKRWRDEGDNNKENVTVPSQDTPPKRRARRRTAKAASGDILSNSSPSRHSAGIAEASNDEVFAYELLKLSGGGRNQNGMSPTPTNALVRSPEKKSISNGMTAVDNGVVRILLELFDLKKTEDRSEKPGVNNA
ncbi:hypothetical protein A7U60_g2559 [Sanghuangporus baumii]|uniref:Uncharacterized protein n=1 Tax=Sanghuangporus baumii TaxID=108892 RepID=A0A9Q5I2E9_SANBA|nr:hypothetical protein A7U60_g2559 [Sanghuangporus baumii]